MPIDTSIYQQPPSQGFNTPFQTLAQIGAIQRQRQEIASNAALEQERQQKLKDDQKKQADADQFNTILTNVGLFNRDAMRAQVQQHAPDKLQSLEKWYADFDKTTEEYQKAKNESEAAAALAEQRKTQVVGTVANGIAAHGYTPTAFAAGLNELGQKFPQSQATWDNYAQLALQNGPGWIKEHVDGLRTMADRSAAAELPEKAAKAEEAQKVNAGTSPTGMTADQQAQEADRQATLAQGAQRIGIEQQRVNIEKNKSAAPDQSKLEQQYRTALLRGMSSRSGGIGLEDAKVQQANHLLSLFEQTYNPKTGGYDIPRVQMNELAMGLAKLTAGSSPAGEGLMREFQQRTAKGDVAGALTWLTGQPVAANTDALTKFMKESIERQGKTAETNREGEMAYLRNLAPTELEEDRRKKLEAVSLNPLRQIKVLTNEKGERRQVVSTDGGQTWQ
jgi:hypothetical protein